MKQFIEKSCLGVPLANKEEMVGIWRGITLELFSTLICCDCRDFHHCPPPTLGFPTLLRH